MQGCGNDYIYVDCFRETVPEPQSLAKRISDRHYGVGGDGLILIEPSQKADAFMHMLNADGSEGRMCGNGVRCVAKYLYDHGLVPPDRRSVYVDTRAGVRKITFEVCCGQATDLTVDMGKPTLTGELSEALTLPGLPLCFTGVDVGNPHAVFLLDDNVALGVGRVADLPLRWLGPMMQEHRRFPDGVNAEFAALLAPDEIDLRVWERGTGETLACGTGAVASVYALFRAGKLAREATVHLPGGALRVRIAADGRSSLSGGAEEVFSGEYPV